MITINYKYIYPNHSKGYLLTWLSRRINGCHMRRRTSFLGEQLRDINFFAELERPSEASTRRIIRIACCPRRGDTHITATCSVVASVAAHTITWAGACDISPTMVIDTEGVAFGVSFAKRTFGHMLEQRQPPVIVLVGGTVIVWIGVTRLQSWYSKAPQVSDNKTYTPCMMDSYFVL